MEGVCCENIEVLTRALGTALIAATQGLAATSSHRKQIQAMG